MESKHTTGPWRVHRYDFDTSGGIKVTTADVGRRVIAEVLNPDNAALIAAAPDMYQALETALAGFTNIGKPGVMSAAMHAIREALAKAEGR